MNLAQNLRQCPDSLLSSKDFFTCRKYEARMSKASCRQRQEYARLPGKKTKYTGHHRIIIHPTHYAGCLNCGQGLSIAGDIKRRKTK